MILAAWIGLAALAPATAAAAEFLEPEEAFSVSATVVAPDAVELRFVAAPDYYLYRDSLRFEAQGARIESSALPTGHVKYDETFAKEVATYRGELKVLLRAQQASDPFILQTTHQGCADAGLCYPPAVLRWRVSLAAWGGDGSIRRAGAVAANGSRFDAFTQSARQTATPTAGEAAQDQSTGAAATARTSSADPGQGEQILRGGSWWGIVASFTLMGLLLALTPCVWPMLPILSSILAGGGPVSRIRGLALALAYSLGMALVYTALGVAAGLAGEGLAAFLQNPWVLSIFAALLGLLALSMFDVFELRLPQQGWSSSLDRLARRLPGGRMGAVFALGGLSALVVSPCVTAPLAGALLFISQTRDVVLGGTALFALAMGMSVPLLLIGVSAGAWLPRSGSWMTLIKHLFGVLLLAVAWWIVLPFLPTALQLAGWGVLLLLAAWLLVAASLRAGLSKAWIGLHRGFAVLLGALAILQFTGATTGATDALKPWANLFDGAAVSTQPLAFQPVRNSAELDALLADAQRPVMLDFYANWCVSCKEMERETLRDPAVQRRLSNALLLKADVTNNTPDDRVLLQRFGLFGPPGMIFFDPRGIEIQGVRVIGFAAPGKFLETLDAAGL